MSWQDTLNTLLNQAAPITQAIAQKQIHSVEDAWTHPAVKAARDSLVAELTRGGTIEQFLEASKELRAQHHLLLQKPQLSAQELRQLGVLSATAYALSADALATAVTPMAIFLHTMHQIVPWLLRAAEVSLLVARIVALSAEHEADAAHGGADREQIEEAIGELLIGTRGIKDIAQTYNLPRRELERLTEIYRQAGRAALGWSS